MSDYASASQPSHSPRILGLDVGSKTIGLAVSDPLGITAQGLNSAPGNKKTDFGQLQNVIAEYGVAEIVVGYPLRMSGVEGIQAEKMQRFAEELRKKFALPVHLWDERSRPQPKPIACCGIPKCRSNAEARSWTAWQRY